MPAKTTDPYVSRLMREEIAAREDPVVWGEGDGPLDPASLAAYEDKGFHAARIFSGTEAARLRAEAERLAAQADRDSDEVVIEPGGSSVRSIFRVHRSSDVFRRAAEDPRLVRIARQLLGSDVYIHQCRINFKPAFDGKEFFWHSDFETWHMEDGMPRTRAVSASIAITDNDEFNGPLFVIPGSHRRYVRCAGETPPDHYHRSLRRQEIGVPSKQAVAALTADGGMAACHGPAGSVTFFECNLMHGSAGNLSPRPRTNLFLVFNSVENALEAPFAGTAPRPVFLGEREVHPIS